MIEFLDDWNRFYDCIIDDVFAQACSFSFFQVVILLSEQFIST